MSDVTIYHNPACGTSRKVLDAIEAKGIEPQVVRYLQVGYASSDRVDLVGSVVAPAGQEPPPGQVHFWHVHPFGRQGRRAVHD